MVKINFGSLFCGILFCLSIASLVIACLAFTKKTQITSKIVNPSKSCITPSYYPSRIYSIPRWWGNQGIEPGKPIGLSENDQKILQNCANLQFADGIYNAATCKICADAWNILNKPGVAWKSSNSPCTPKAQGVPDKSCNGEDVAAAWAAACSKCAESAVPSPVPSPPIKCSECTTDGKKCNGCCVLGGSGYTCLPDLTGSDATNKKFCENLSSGMSKWCGN